MKYFELFGLAPKVNIDMKALKLKYFALSKSFHPDFFTLESVEKQMEAMDQSTLINNAYKALKSEDSRLQYILNQQDLLSKDSNEQMPSDFLMEMMDLNEQIMELDQQNTSAIKSFQSEVEQMGAHWRKSVEHLFNKDFITWSSKEWEEVKEFFLKKRYIRRLLQNLEGQSEL